MAQEISRKKEDENGKGFQEITFYYFGFKIPSSQTQFLGDYTIYVVFLTIETQTLFAID